MKINLCERFLVNLELCQSRKLTNDISYYLSMENAIIVTIRTCDANSEITVARSQPKSPKGHGYDFQIIVNSNGITKIIVSV